MSRFSSPEELENTYVREVYDQIAPLFAHSKYKTWPKVEQFLRSFSAGSLIADVGCGTGRYLGISDEALVIGAERSKRFAEIARDRKFEVVVCDNIALPYRANCLDGIISVGVIHHFASVKRRLTALREMARVLIPGGRMLVCVWAVEQSERKFDGPDVLVPFNRGKGKRAVMRRRAIGIYPGFRKYTGQPSSELDADTQTQGVHPEDNNGCKTMADHDEKANSINSNLIPDDAPQARKLPKIFSSLENHALFNNVFKMLKDGLVSSDNCNNDRKKKDGILPLAIARVFERTWNSHEDKNECESAISPCAENSSSICPLPVKIRTCESNLASRRPLSKSDHCLHQSLEHTRAFSKNRSNFSENESPTEGFSSCHVKHKNGHSCSSSPNVIKFDNADCVSDRSKFSESASNEARTKSSRMGLNLLARLMESISSSSSDTDSDSSLSSDYINSDSSLSDTDQLEVILPTVSSKSFTHSTVCCHATPECNNAFVTVNPIQSGQGAPAQSKELQRYYHVFRKGELVQLIEQGVPSLRVVKEYYDHGNWAVIIQKT